jgi:uncharacterized protein (TIGR02466 family)
MPELETLFCTPIYTHIWSGNGALNDELKTVILESEKNSEGLSRSNHGGWHSEEGLFSWNDPCIATLREQVASVTRDIIGREVKRSFKFGMSSWANVSRRGNYNNVHSHVGSLWPGVYFVAKGEEDNDDPENGRLELIDPRVGVPPQGTKRHLIYPLPGLAVFFPSWLKHMVHPYLGTGVRISIAFNVNVQFEHPAG